MGGQVQQSSSAPPYDHHGFSGSHAASAATDPTEAVMSRWLQSAGLQHLAPPTGSPALDPRLLQNVLIQDFARHGVQSAEDRQKLFRLIKSINGGLEHGSDPFTPPAYGSARQNGAGGMASPEFRGDIGGGILDLHSIDDIELLSEDGVHESPFEASPFVSGADKSYQNDPDVFWSSNKPRTNKMKTHEEGSPLRTTAMEKELPPPGTNGLARIKVVVRKRPLNKKELARKEEDIVAIDGNGCSLTVHEPKLKVDLTAYVEKHDFTFDAVLNDQVSNDEVYRETVEPIIPTIFQRTKATCFAYGQTGSGKTYTMQPLPLRACQDILNLMQHPAYRNQGFQLWLSFFEIYGGKLYDLLNERRKLCMREDGRQQVVIVGLKEFSVSHVEVVKDYIEKGNSSRSTGSTGANEESSRSHAILQLAIKKHSNKKDEKGGKPVGKFSFIDLAGSERGADTTDNDRQTRIEGAEINKSLLALKECIRALDSEQGHIPFRGSKLTEVLRDSFVGDSRTVMISCISPSTGSCEHTLNTLRYADRVKGLSKNSNSKRDPSPNTGVPLPKEIAAPTPPPTISPEMSDDIPDYRVMDSKKAVDQSGWTNPQAVVEPELWSFTSSNQSYANREDTAMTSFSMDRVSVRDSVSNGFSYQRDPVPEKNEQERVSPPRRKTVKDDKQDKHREYAMTEMAKIEKNMSIPKRPVTEPNTAQSRPKETYDAISQNGYDNNISAILEEEEDLIAAHRLEVEDTMELVREEMRLLTEVDQPGSRIDKYVSQLSYVLSRKAAGIVNLQARLARFQRHLKEQEILSRNMTNGRQHCV
uniref:Kinesin-like protein n=1 Tax=Marsilea vestita TaxID=59764 RepID=A0A142KWC2_MARVE|nr:kinesin 13b protein [Marsilea vestita]